ncbi:MAG: FAD-dependent thymidylate synthase [Anaerolineae bacterium]|nr:FAD-dependent thymidylate synthase [Anaerolineae bacterium]
MSDNASLIGKRVNVLDKGFIELQALMGDDLAIVNAARVSFLGESKGADKDKKLLFYLLRNKHTSPFEMVEFKFRIRCPLVTWWQLVRHRTLNLNLQSGRYTPFEENDFYVPEVWRKQATDNKQASEGTLEGPDGEALTRELIEHYTRSYALYQQAMQKGVAREMARLFLPGFAVYYTGVIKCDAHNLMHLMHLRMANEAQYEIRVYAQAICEHFFKPALPWTAEAFEQYVLHNAP